MNRYFEYKGHYYELVTNENGYAYLDSPQGSLDLGVVKNDIQPATEEQFIQHYKGYKDNV